MKVELNDELVFNVIVEATNYISSEEFRTLDLEVFASVADYIAGRVENKIREQEIIEGEII